MALLFHGRLVAKQRVEGDRVVKILKRRNQKRKQHGKQEAFGQAKAGVNFLRLIRA